MADVLLSERAHEWLETQQPDIADRVKQKLRRAGENPEHFLEPLKGVPEYKLRIGDYRAIIEWRKPDAELRVQKIGHRKDIYR